MGERAGLALTGVLMALVSRSREVGILLVVAGAAGVLGSDWDCGLLFSFSSCLRAWIFSFLLRDLLADSKSSSTVLGCIDLTLRILGNRPGESYFSFDTVG